WTGDLAFGDREAIGAQVPIISEDSELVGVVTVAEAYPTLGDRARRWLPDLVTFLGIGLLLGVVGSWLLSRLIRRRTRGLEPAAIAALADQRDAMLHSIREGVLAVSAEGRVTVLSDSARELLALREDDFEGRRLVDLPLDVGVLEVLVGEDDVHDRVLMVDGRLIVLNRNRIHHEGRAVGTVTTLRDRTELLAMQSELSARESVTETLRAQTHEFNNQLHTISGLVQLEEYGEVSSFIGRLTRRRAEINESVTKRIDDPAVAALLIAKVSLGAERGVDVVLAEDASLPRLAPALSADVGTVLGNLVDNAVDATVAAGGPRIDVRLRLEDTVVSVQVADTGPGVAEDAAEEIFRRGWSTKSSDASGRGVGLALVQVICERRGGAVSVHNDSGAVFTARLPLEPPEEQA
ncbi:MAG TPA: ATP-binding protein, partial [Nocardioides sp.]